MNWPSHEQNAVDFAKVGLATLRSVLYIVTAHFDENSTAYKLVAADGTGESLIGTIKAGMRYYELVREGTLNGDIHLSKWGNA
jgi:hypothetical protein